MTKQIVPWLRRSYLLYMCDSTNDEKIINEKFVNSNLYTLMQPAPVIFS